LTVSIVSTVTAKVANKSKLSHISVKTPIKKKISLPYIFHWA